MMGALLKKLNENYRFIRLPSGFRFSIELMQWVTSNGGWVTRVGNPKRTIIGCETMERREFILDYFRTLGLNVTPLEFGETVRDSFTSREQEVLGSLDVIKRL